jgi:hypothetical protein
VLPALVLAFSASVQGIHMRRASMMPRHSRLAQLIPSAPVGWSGRDVPLGATEVLTTEAKEALNFDDMVYREFTKESVSFGVYVAYWKPGKMPIQDVSSHTPDRCWTENGWHCLETRSKQRENLDGATLWPAEWRLFEPPDGGPPTYVLFWHLVDGQTYDFGRSFDAISRPSVWVRGAVQQFLHGNGEQYFMRLTSNVPLEHLWKDPGFGEVMRSLADLGLATTAPAHPKA